MICLWDSTLSSPGGSTPKNLYSDKAGTLADVAEKKIRMSQCEESQGPLSKDELVYTHAGFSAEPDGHAQLALTIAIQGLGFGFWSYIDQRMQL